MHGSDEGASLENSGRLGSSLGGKLDGKAKEFGKVEFACCHSVGSLQCMCGSLCKLSEKLEKRTNSDSKSVFKLQS